MSRAAYAKRARSGTALPDRRQYASLAAPIGGINTVSPGAEMPLTDCIYAYNLLGGEFGLRSRLGSREWVTGIASGGAPEQVRSLLAFHGSLSDRSADRLFACSGTGIWDVTSSTTTPSQVVVFPATGASSGWGSSVCFVTTAGHFLVYCDELNGMYVYTESTNTWAKIAQGSGAGEISVGDPTKFVHVCAWKNRLWFVERDTSKGWYLGLNALYGAAAAFTFGARFAKGGELRGLFSWTKDAGAGIDDMLVAISGGGDIVIYAGTDPSAPSTFALVGVWYVPGVPLGRRLATDYGGDLLILSSVGIVELSKLTGGAEELDRQQYSTFKVSNLFNQLMAASSSLKGWGMVLHPSDAALLVLSPVAPSQPTEPLVMSLSTKGWSRYRDIPVGVCAAALGQTLYYGTEDGRVGINDGTIDGVTLADPTSYTPIGFSFLTAFHSAKSPKRKRIHEISVSVLSQGGSIPVTAEARYGYDFVEPAPPPATTGGAAGAWSSGLWGSAVWGGAYAPQRLVFGAAGWGAQMAIAVRGLATTRTTITDLGLSYSEGGML